MLSLTRYVLKLEQFLSGIPNLSIFKFSNSTINLGTYFRSFETLSRKQLKGVSEKFAEENFRPCHRSAKQSGNVFLRVVKIQIYFRVLYKWFMLLLDFTSPTNYFKTVQRRLMRIVHCANANLVNRFSVSDRTISFVTKLYNYGINVSMYRCINVAQTPE